MKKLSIKRSRRGFTLIELMVVVVIIGVLVILGLRFYSGQVEKAKNAVIKANVGTIQTLIQAELAERSVGDLDEISELNTIIFEPSGIHNPVTGATQPTCPASEELASAGEVWVTHANSTFQINGRNATNTRNVFVISFEAIK